MRRLITALILCAAPAVAEVDLDQLVADLAEYRAAVERAAPLMELADTWAFMAACEQMAAETFRDDVEIPHGTITERNLNFI